MTSKLERLLAGGTVAWDRALVTDGLSPEAVAQITAVTPAAPDTYPVPDLRGMTVEQARDQADIVNGTFQILEAGSEASDTDVGLIVRQDPDPKTEKKGELPITIQVWVSART